MVVSHFPPASIFDTACGSLWRNDIVKMMILNVCVVCLSSKKTILPWNIVSASEAEHTFHEFFRSRQANTSMVSFDLHKAEVGTSKDKLDTLV